MADDDLRPEYDLARLPGGVMGKYASDGMRTGVWADAENKTVVSPDAKGRPCTLYRVGGLAVWVPVGATPGEIVAAAVAAERERCARIAEDPGMEYDTVYEACDVPGAIRTGIAARIREG